MNPKIIFLFIHLFAFLLSTVGCSNVPTRTYIGAALGGGFGAALGHQAHQTDESRIIGAVVGAGLGSLIAYTAGKKSKPETDLQRPSKPGDEAYPALTKPKLRSIWVPDKIEGNQYIKGHYIYIIEDPGTWTR